VKESDLYLPLKTFLEKQDYEVKAEIENCDVVAMKKSSDDEENYPPTIVELKLSLNLNVILQAVDRLLLSPVVYIGVPHNCGALKKQRKRIIKLLKMLGIGLLVINPKRKTVKLLVDPTSYQPKQSKPKQRWLIEEFVTRVGDPNLGGASTKKGVITAYRQKAIEIANHLNKHGTMKASDIAKALDIPNSRNILYDNHYGWFEGLGKGWYQLSKLGSEISNTFIEK
jgi:hypothetical protein